MLRRLLTAATLTALTCQAQPTPQASTIAALLTDLVTANHILANEGVLDGYGHVSVRNPANPNHYFLARAVAPGLATISDIIEYDLDSNPIQPSAGSGATGSSGYLERFIHGEIYRSRPDVMSVVHSHSPEVIPFADTQVPLRPMHHMGWFIGPGVPIFEIRNTQPQSDMLISTPALAKALAKVLSDKHATLMRGHGAVIAAPSLKLVTGMAYYLNLNARLQYQALQLGSGKVTYLDPEESKRAVQNYERSWDYWKTRLPK